MAFFSCIKQYKNEFGHSSELAVSIEIQVVRKEKSKPLQFLSPRLQNSARIYVYTLEIRNKFTWWLNVSYPVKTNQSTKINCLPYTTLPDNLIFRGDSATLSAFPCMPLTALFLVQLCPVRFTFTLSLHFDI